MAILFDLDGTLLDTSHDICLAVNLLLTEENQPQVPYAELRPLISFGAKKILAAAFKLDPNSQAEELKRLSNRLLELYRLTNFENTAAFPGIDILLNDIEQIPLPWGIVTNKIHALTEPLLKATGYWERSQCVVSGDTTAKSKPHPEPLYHACELLQVAPHDCLYIGDSATDIQAGKAAGMATMAVAFGYIPPGETIAQWNADFNVNSAAEILPWIKKWSENTI